MANDRTNTPNYLYKNNGDGTFTDVSQISGTDILINAMSTTIGDYNNDGWFDIYITDSNKNIFLKNNGDGTFTNVASITGTTFDSIGWGAVFLDADNDTDLDLYVSGNLDGSTTLPSAFYENQGNGIFNIPSNIGFVNDTLPSFSNAIGDVDNDGFPEIIVLNNKNNNIFLWKNTTTSTNNWLKVKLEGTTSNRDGIGSVIEIGVNGYKQYRYTLNGEGYLGQNTGSEFFGVGTATNIDYVKVTWLGSTVDLFTNVTPNQTLNIIEGQTLGIDKFNLADILLFPNPVRDKLTIQIKIDGLGDNKVELYTVLGKKIFSKKFTSNNKELDLTNISSGIYLLRFTSGNRVINRRVVIE